MSLPPWLIVTGDFVPTGGMDMANLAFASYLSEKYPVHLVAHRVERTLATSPNVQAQLVPRPLGSHLLGDILLRRAARRLATDVHRSGGRVVVNGGNCHWHDVVWLHYVHAAFTVPPSGSIPRRLKTLFASRRFRRTERQVVARAKRIICNSRLTAQHAIELLGAQESAVSIVYYGCDSRHFSPVDLTQKLEARHELGWAERPWVVFVGAMGDSRKGFDTVYAAWQTLCNSTSWDANLAVAGQGADLPRWCERARQDGLDGRIRFLGFRTDIPRILAGADLMIHPARYEAYGLGVHEALCTGLPVVVSATAGVAEQYPPELSELLLENPSNPLELTERLRAWRHRLESWPTRIAPFATRLRARTWEMMAQEIEEAVLDSPSPINNSCREARDEASA